MRHEGVYDASSGPAGSTGRRMVAAPPATAAPPVTATAGGEETVPTLPPYEPNLPEPTPFDPLRPGQSVVSHLGHRYTAKPALEPSERRAVIASLFFEGSRKGPFERRFYTLMALAVMIAVLGLMADSTAVVIGAMLVAPLMAPVLAVSAALVMGWPARIRSNLKLAAIGSGGAVVLAAAVGVLARGELDPIPAEALARTAPNLLDLGIAAAAGGAGAYGYVRRQASDALAGAAVAVALVPPLSVSGLMLQMGEFQLAGGAALLFLVNVAGVLASGAATFLVAGLAPGQRLLAAGSQIQDGLRWAAIATIIVALPLQFGQQSLLPVPIDPDDVESAIETWSESHDRNVETVDVGVDYQDGEAKVDLVIATPDKAPPLDELVEVVGAEASEPVTVDIQVIATDRSLVATDEDGKATEPAEESVVTTTEGVAEDVVSSED